MYVVGCLFFSKLYLLNIVKYMYNDLKLTGGARIGMKNASYPFATLEINKEVMMLKVDLLGYYEFRPTDIISMEIYTRMPILGNGIRINHRLSTYNSKIIFWTMKNPDEVIKMIQSTGFMDEISSELSVEDQLLLKRQIQTEFPINPFVFLLMFLAFIASLQNSYLFFPTNGNSDSFFQRLILIASFIIWLTCLIILISKSVQKRILIKGWTFDLIKKSVILVFCISLVICVSSIIILY